MVTIQDKQLQKLTERLSKFYSYEPEYLAQKLGLRGAGKVEGTQIFKNLLELLSELDSLSVNRLPQKIQVRVVPAVRSAADVLEQVDGFSFRSLEKKRMERCEILERVRSIQHEIQRQLICPNC